MPRSLSLLPLLALAHALGILAADTARVARPGALVAASAGVGLATLARTAPLRAAGSALIAASAGALALLVRLDDATRDAPTAPSETILDARVGSVRVVGRRAFVDLETSRRDVEGRPLPRRIRLIEDLSRDPGLGLLAPGDALRLAARLRPPEARHDPGVPDARRRLAREGVGALVRLADPTLRVALEAPGGSAALARIAGARARIRERLLAMGEGGGLLAALAVGDRRGLSIADREAFARLGLTHLLSVSGLHLVLAAALFHAVAWALLRHVHAVARRDARRTALAVALLGATAYALLAGFDVPVQRSLVFVAVATLAFLARRPIQPATLLGAAALLVLVRDPAALFDVGAQLSFAASAALLLAAPLAARGAARTPAAPRIWTALREGLSTSALATAATAPLLATQLGVSAPAGLAANAVAVPWTGLVLLPASLLAAACAVLPENDLSCPALDALALLGSGSLEALRAAAGLAGDVAPATPPPRTAVWIAGLALAGLALRLRRTRARLAVALGAALLPVLVPPSPRPPALPRVTFLDVGQGDATLVQGREGTLLVDGGSAFPDGADLGRSVVAPSLRALGVRHLDVVAATHADLDHRGGLVSLLAAFTVGELWLPYGAASDAGFDRLRGVAAEHRVPIRETGAGDAILRRGDLAISALWPPREVDAVASRNERSLVLRVEVGGRGVLLAGDAGLPSERALVGAATALRSDVLKLGHHGSRTASGDAWLRAVAPQLVVASAPCRGRFGMPHGEVVDRVARAGASLWWTGRDGAISVGLGAPLVASGEAPPGACARRLGTRPEPGGVPAPAPPRPAPPRPARRTGARGHGGAPAQPRRAAPLDCADRWPASVSSRQRFWSASRATSSRPSASISFSTSRASCATSVPATSRSACSRA